MAEKGLKAAGLKTPALQDLKGSDPRKLMLADLLWRQTTVSQEWLAEKLCMKSAANVSQQLRRIDRKQATAKLPDALQTFLADAMSAKIRTMKQYLSKFCTLLL